MNTTSTLTIYMEFLETIPDAALIADQFGKIVHANDELVALFRARSRLDFVGGGVEKLMPALVRETHRRHFETYWETPKRRSMGSGRIFQAERHNGETFPVDIMLTPLRLDGIDYVLAVLRDRTAAWNNEVALREALEREQELAYTDSLTGAANLRHFMVMLQRSIDELDHFGRPFTVAYFDLDNFKAVNDKQGHAEGDRVLRWLTSLASAQLRRNDLIARVGGDEFAVLMPDARSEGVEHRVRELLELIQQDLQHNGWPVTLSTGVMSFEAGQWTADQVLDTVDHLMYRVKRAGRDGVLFRNHSRSLQASATGTTMSDSGECCCSDPDESA